MKKNVNIYKFIVLLCYVIPAFLLLYCIKVRINPNTYLETKTRLFVFFLIFVLIYIAGLILVKKLKYNKRILKINLIIYLLLYTMLIFSLTLFDEIYGRQGLIIIRWNKSLLNYYSNHYFNMIPFKTINLFIKGYAKNIVTLRSLFINVIGNFLIFMPYSIFLPLIFKNKKYFNYLIIMLIYIITIEFLQFITMSGSCDIDDLILNISGFSVIFLILKNNIVYKYINKIFLLEDDA